MQSIIALTLSVLAATITAAPTTQALPRQATGAVQVQFSNIVTGANGNAFIPLNGTPVSLGQAYANTNLEVDGTLFVTSFQFTSNFQGVACDVVKDGVTLVASIVNPVRDFQTFSQKPLNWQNGFAIICE